MSGERRLDAEFLTGIARRYNEHVEAGQKPGPGIAAAMDVPVATAHRWIYEARKRGALPPATPGLASGHTPKQLGRVGRNVLQNVHQLRQARRFTFVELSERLSAAGRPIPVLGLRRLETGTRRVDVDDLAALAEVFGVPPGFLMEPPAACVTCHGAPPLGFACTECSTTNTPATEGNPA